MATLVAKDHKGNIMLNLYQMIIKEIFYKIKLIFLYTKLHKYTHFIAYESYICLSLWLILCKNDVLLYCLFDSKSDPPREFLVQFTMDEYDPKKCKIDVYIFSL